MMEPGRQRALLACLACACAALALVCLTSESSVSLLSTSQQADKLKIQNQKLKEENIALMRVVEGENLMQRASSALSISEKRAMRESARKAKAHSLKAVHGSVKAARFGHLSHTEMDREIAQFKATVTENDDSQVKLSQETLSVDRMIAKAHKLTRLLGSYVQKCDDGKDCEKGYIPEKDEDYEAAQHTVESHDFLPLGKPHEVPADIYNRPQNEITPKNNKLGGNWVTFGAKDAFVPVDESGLSTGRTLPPWKQEQMKEATETKQKEDTAALPKVEAKDTDHLHCPGDPTGRNCLTDSDGVDGVSERTLFSSSHDDTGDVLKRRGVVVDNWPAVGGEAERHNWNRQAVDHPPPPPKDIDWTKLKNPQWSFNNAAMRSQGWNPEGEKNQRLMLGAGYADNDPSFEDSFLSRKEYKKQVQVRANYHPLKDHFADWDPPSDKNVRLLYGESEMMNGKRWSPTQHKYVKDKWTLFRNKEPVDEATAEFTERPHYGRTGDPLSDAVNNRGWWSGANMVAANSNNIDEEQPKKTAREMHKLEKQGVNVDDLKLAARPIALHQK